MCANIVSQKLTVLNTKKKNKGRTVKPNKYLNAQCNFTLSVTIIESEKYIADTMRMKAMSVGSNEPLPGLKPRVSGLLT